MLREHWQVAQDELVWVTNHEEVRLVGVRWDTTDNLGVSVLELGVTSELFPLFLIGV